MSDNRSAESCDILFEYLRSILYDDQIRQPDLSTLDEPFQKLGAGMQVLQRAVEEMKTYSGDLSMGNLSGQFPSKDNFLCANLKNLHANLNHLTWQAQQVAMGDYSQHVSYLGEFSEAFNTMIAQLKAREDRLMEDLSENIQEERRLASRAYYDAGTGIHNRFYFEEYMTRQLAYGCRMVFCFLDIDGLKYVNDNFGHSAGDAYIRRFVTEIRNSFRTTDLFARIGGDEFCLMLLDVSADIIERKLEKIRRHFIQENSADYPASFSYGLVEAGGPEERRTLRQIVDTADSRMYEYKKKYKKSAGRQAGHTSGTTETGRQDP